MNKLPKEIYEEIKQNEPADLDTRVLLVMWEHRGKKNKISRRELVEKVCNVALPSNVNLGSLSIDRQVRRALERLEKRYPILGSSGEGGYWIADDPIHIQKIIDENDRKANKLLEKNKVLSELSLELFGPQMVLPGVR